MQRTRSQGGHFLSVVCPYSERQRDCSMTSWVLLGNLAGCKTGTYRTMTDVVTSDFVKRRSQGEIIMSPMNRTIDTSSCSNATGHWIRHSNVSCTSTGFKQEYKFDSGSFPFALVNGGVAPISYLITDQEVEQIAALVSTATWANRGKYTGSNLYETLAELKKTSQLWKNLGGRLLNVVRKPVSSIADEHLMFKFGLKPLLQDIQFLLDRTIDPLGRLRDRKFTRQQQRIEKNSSQTGLTCALSNHGTFTYSTQTKDELVVRGVSVDDFTGGPDIDSWGLSPKSLITLPWELTGYSFVADYFANIGDFLNAITPAIGYDFRGSALTVQRTTSTVSTANSFVTASPWSLVGGAPSGSLTRTIDSKVRTALRAPSIVLQYNPLFKGDELNFGRAATLFELCVQKLRR